MVSMLRQFRYYDSSGGPRNPRLAGRPLPILISTKADLYITGREEGQRRGGKVRTATFSCLLLLGGSTRYCGSGNLKGRLRRWGKDPAKDRLGEAGGYGVGERNLPREPGHFVRGR